jgi:hypothetical protein
MSWIKDHKQKFRLSLEQQTKYWYRLAVIVLTFGVLDTILTHLVLSRFGIEYEANTVLRILYKESILVFVGFQFVVLVFVVGVIYYLLIHFLTVDRTGKTGFERIDLQERVFSYLLSFLSVVGVLLICNNLIVFLVLA